MCRLRSRVLVAHRLRREVVKSGGGTGGTMRTPGSCDEHALLIVDDDESIRGFLCELLSTEGYSVKAARNGHEALTFLQGGFRPCLILLDLNMPVMDGRQFCAERDKRPDMAS